MVADGPHEVTAGESDGIAHNDDLDKPNDTSASKFGDTTNTDNTDNATKKLDGNVAFPPPLPSGDAREGLGLGGLGGDVGVGHQATRATDIEPATGTEHSDDPDTQAPDSQDNVLQGDDVAQGSVSRDRLHDGLAAATPSDPQAPDPAMPTDPAVSDPAVNSDRSDRPPRDRVAIQLGTRPDKGGYPDRHDDAAHQSRDVDRWSYRKERTLIKLALPAAATAADSPATVDVRTEIPPPLVLVGNPRLGSQPAALPKVPGVPDSVLDGAAIPGIVIRAASLRGDDHRFYGETRQDSIAMSAVRSSAAAGEPDAVIACVADGVGSQPMSHVGSAKACRLFTRSAEARLAELMNGSQSHDVVRHCRAVVDDICAGMRTTAQRWNLAAKSLSTTLAAAVVTPTVRGWRVLLFTVGDSTAIILDKSGWNRPFGSKSADDADLLSTATDALPTQVGDMPVRVLHLLPGDLLLLCSDGLANPMRNESVADQLSEWWGGGKVPSLPEFYWQLSFRAQTFGDDRSAVCMWFT